MNLFFTFENFEKFMSGMLGMFGGEETLDPLKPQFEAKFKEIIHDLLNDESFVKNLTSQSETDNSLLGNVQEIVDQRLEELDLKKEIVEKFSGMKHLQVGRIWENLMILIMISLIKT
jgi:hypothetical protein